MLCSHPDDKTVTHAIEAAGDQDITLAVCLHCGATKRTVKVRGQVRDAGKWVRPTMGIEDRIAEVVASLDGTAEGVSPNPDSAEFQDDMAFLSNLKVGSMLATSLLVHVKQCDLGWVSTSNAED